KEMVRLQASLAHGSRAEELRPKTATSLRAEEASEASSVWSDQGPRQTRESSDGSWELLRPGMPWECETHLTLVVLTVECYKLLHRCRCGLDPAGRTRSPTASSAYKGAVVQGTSRPPRRRTSRDPAAFWPFERFMNQIHMSRKAQGMRLP